MRPPLFIAGNSPNTIVNTFVNNVIADGGTADANLILNEYNDLHPLIKKQSSMVFIGGAYKTGVAYGMDPQTSVLIPFTFSRTGTATRVNRDGFIETVAANIPRYDYDPVTKWFKGLLMEKASTNLCVRSEEFDNASWPKSNATVTVNAIISPDGTATADKVIGSVAGGVSLPHYVFQQPSVTLGTDYSFSTYAKAGEHNCLVVVLTNSRFGTDIFGGFNLITGECGFSTPYGTGTNISIRSTPIGNGWYRCTLTAQAASTGASLIQLRTQPSYGTGDTNYIGNGINGIYLWGAQLEASAYPTSYIPTAGSSVSRGQDICSTPATGIVNALSGTLYGKAQQAFDISAPSRAVLSIGADNTNRITIYKQQSSRFANTFVQPGGQAFTGSSIPIGAVWKQAAAYNGSLISTADSGTLFANNVTSGLVPANIATTTISISNSFPGGTEALDGWIRHVAIVPFNLSNAELQSITA